VRYIILSFDDGRKDTYEVAYKLLCKYDITASVHVITGFVDGTIKIQGIKDMEAMSIDNVVEMARHGFDISSHGDRHINKENDLRNSLLKLKEWGILNANEAIVFSSPYSEIYKGNIRKYSEMLKRNKVKYLRSGDQVRRNGILYSMMYLCQKLIKCNILFYFLNRRNVIRVDRSPVQSNDIVILNSVSIKYWNTIKQLNYFVRKLKDGEAVIFLFHSILHEQDILKKDDWIFPAEKFEQFLKILKREPNIKTLNIKEYINLENWKKF
jgi:hypothetical protein